MSLDVRAGVLVLVLLGCTEPPTERQEEVPEPAATPASEPARELEREPRTVTLAASGDLVLNPHAMRAVLDDGEDGYEHLLAGYGESLRPREIAFLNLEQPLVNDLVPLDAGWPRQDTSRPRRSPVLGATPPLADALAAAGLDVVSVTNNHAYDQGRAGLLRTIEELDRVHIAAVGAGVDAEAAYAPVVLERGGVRVAFVAFSAFFNQHPSTGSGAVAARLDDERIAASLAAAREVADVVVVSAHWGRDFVTEARSSERRLARRLVEQGADVILGAGPHVLHSVERLPSPRGEAVVAYSLGNVVSGMGRTYRVGHPPHGWIHPANVTPEARDGVVLRVSIQLDDGVRITALDADPLWTENNWLAHRADGVPHRVSVRRLALVGHATREERFPLVAAALGDSVALSLSTP